MLIYRFFLPEINHCPSSHAGPGTWGSPVWQSGWTTRPISSKRARIHHRCQIAFEVSSEGRLQPQCCLSQSMQKLILPGPRPAPPLQKPQPGQSWLPRKEAAVTVVFCDEAERPYHALLRSTPRPDKFQPFGFPTTASFPIEDPPIPKHSSRICPKTFKTEPLPAWLYHFLQKTQTM